MSIHGAERRKVLQLFEHTYTLSRCKCFGVFGLMLCIHEFSEIFQIIN